jgi:hypothetical protein
MNLLLDHLSTKNFADYIFTGTPRFDYRKKQSKTGVRRLQRAEQLAAAIDRLAERLGEIQGARDAAPLVTVCHKFYPLCTTEDQKNAWLRLHSAMIPLAWKYNVDPQVSRAALPIFQYFSTMTPADWVADFTLTFSDSLEGVRVPLPLLKYISDYFTASQTFREGDQKMLSLQNIAQETFQTLIHTLISGKVNKEALPTIAFLADFWTSPYLQHKVSEKFALDIQQALLEKKPLPSCPYPLCLDVSGILTKEEEGEVLRGLSSKLVGLKWCRLLSSTDELSGLSHLTSLQSLDLSRAQLPFGTLNLKGLQKLPLKELKLNHCPLSKQALTIIRSLPLRRLELQSVFLNEETVRILDGHPTLEELDLSNNPDLSNSFIKSINLQNKK